MRNPSRDKAKTPTTDSERETQVLLEDVRSNLRVVAEGHTAIVGRLDKIEGCLEGVEGRLDKVETKLTHHDQEFLKLHGRFDKLEEQVSSVLTDHESRLKVLESK